MKFVSRYDYVSPKGETFTEPTLAQQQFAQECDVNFIISNFVKTGVLSSENTRQAVFADVSNVPDYQGHLDAVLAINEQFDLLPSDVRKKFDNNPEVMVQWLQDDNNLEDAVNLGLLSKKPLEVSKESSDVKVDELSDVKVDELPIVTE